ncbi:unnamed protein product [Blepharisma stoltei]|uniref:Uncharacterized protein n=1 Tax=Blepharisma stoltei TaxID=1481888 RepID=A0AAU9JPQ9_9CILI|nr:unnamed protein product [Blepharisma stoltei]
MANHRRPANTPKRKTHPSRQKRCANESCEENDNNRKGQPRATRTMEMVHKGYWFLPICPAAFESSIECYWSFA